MECEIGLQETVSEAVVLSVSAFEDQAPMSLPPLFGVVDPDALSEICQERDDERSQSEVTVSFSYSNSQVTVENGETIIVTTS